MHRPQSFLKLYAKKVVEIKAERIESTHQRVSLKTTIVGRETKMTNEEDKEVLAEKDDAIEQMRVNENRVKIDRVMEFCVSFTKVQWGEEINPHHLFLELMEFLVNKQRRRMMYYMCHFFHSNISNVELLTLNKRLLEGNNLFIHIILTKLFMF